MVNVKPVQLGTNTRMSFAKINEVLEMPNLIEVQKNSYEWFLKQGLKEVFSDVAATSDYTGNLVLDFVDYRIDDEPKYTVAECKERDVTYAAPLRVTARLLNKETGEVKEQEIFMGDFPLMTESGTFVINGAERVIVSQLVRSPGVYFMTPMIKPAKSCTLPPLTQTAARGLSTRRIPTTFSMSVSIKTGKFRLPPLSVQCSVCATMWRRTSFRTTIRSAFPL